MQRSPDESGVYAAAVVLMVAATIAVAFRFQVRRMKQAPLGGDDLLVTVSMVRLLETLEEEIALIALGHLAACLCFSPDTHRG